MATSKTLKSASASNPGSTGEKKSSTSPLEASTQLPTKERLIVNNEKEKKKQAFFVRAFWTIVMILGMFLIIGSGHFLTILMVIVLEGLVFKELILITSENAKVKELKYTKYLNWYLLITTISYLEGRSLMNFVVEYLVNHNISAEIPIYFINHHNLISYCLYVLAFIGFVSNLKKGYLKFQFGQLCITNMILLFCIFQGHCIVNNILNGMIWFLLPVGLVITNDIFAYICGITFGKTQLISISPKKTVEGFLGAWLCTMFMSTVLTYYLCNFNYFICPIKNYNDLSLNCLNSISCELNSVFIHQIYKIPIFAQKYFNREFIEFKPIYLHSIILSMFASLIAPFGGFFASGLKRAFKIKDFGDTIPGHGGVTDRMDCQFLMGSFSYLYYETFINNNQINVANVLQHIIINLSNEDIFILVKSLHLYLFKVGLISEEKFQKLIEILD